MSQDQDNRRIYVFLGAILGLVVGGVIEFSQEHAAGVSRMLSLLVFALTGAVLGYLFFRDGGKDAGEHPSPPEPVKNPDEFFRQSGIFFPDELRQHRVRPLTMPMSPPGSMVRIREKEIDHYVRVPVIEGVLEKMEIQEIAERALSEAALKAPPQLSREPEFELVSFYSEGPLQDDGRSPWGWSLILVDGALGLGCQVTTTRREIALRFYFLTTWPKAAPWEWFDLREVLAIVHEAIPAWKGRSLYIKVNLPDDVLVFVRDPIEVADVDVVQGKLRNKVLAEPVVNTDDDDTAFALPELLTWFRCGETDPEGQLAVAVEDQEFRSGLRTLAPDAMMEAAAAIERQRGPALVDELVAAIHATDDAAERSELLSLLAWVPSGLAVVALYGLSVESGDEALAAQADALHKQWRRGELEVSRDLLDNMGFLESQRRLGRKILEVVALRPTYDPEGDLFPTLLELGLIPRRRQLLSGETELLIGCAFRSESGGTEARLTSTSLPVTCHILHLVGEEAGSIAARLRKSEVAWTNDSILDAVFSGRMIQIHQASLYIETLQLDEPSIVPVLIDAAERMPHNEDFQRALRGALRVQSAPEAQAFLQTDDEPAPE